jgi:hypothetical protein
MKSQENKEIERQFEDYQNSTEKKMKQLQNEIGLWKKKDEETATVNDFYFHSLCSPLLKTNRFFLFSAENKRRNGNSDSQNLQRKCVILRNAD